MPIGKDESDLLTYPPCLNQQKLFAWRRRYISPTVDERFLFIFFFFNQVYVRKNFYEFHKKDFDFDLFASRPICL